VRLCRFELLPLLRKQRGCLAAETAAWGGALTYRHDLATASVREHPICSCIAGDAAAL